MDAVFLMNMGGGRDEEESKQFIYNMFKDKRIIPSFMRHILAPIITTFRYKKVWQNYEEIGGSPIYKHTQNLINKLQKKVNIPIYSVMRYTSPRAKDVIKKHNIKSALLFPLYPHYSTTTVESSFDDVEGIEVKKIYRFYKDELFNEAIIDKILEAGIDKDTNLIFSAHGLPQKIVDNGDTYEKEINEHLDILKKLLDKRGILYKSINLAYQSKVGPMKWLEPSLDDMLEKFKNQKVLIYPISFIIDNSETDLELKIEYAQIAKKLNIDYKVAQCVNDSDKFVEFLANKINNIVIE
jgi:ferrochelatase